MFYGPQIHPETKKQNMQKKCILRTRLKTIRNDENQTKLSAFDNDCFTDHKNIFRCSYNFILYLI